ncbi:hypothetical protein [Bradyrhizobium sp. Leo170]|uniref:hypothetical protein n=1 Tax=Bradyrhizobium sp. Leo170 TaxID=1571199 RepID=UPI00102E3EBF|nr:hypothetical protein [Bradyrhizobium sp. Leo170]
MNIAQPGIATDSGDTSSLEGYAAALANIGSMVNDLTDARAIIGQLRADLHREQDRLELLLEERNRFRSEALVFRTKLIELATAMANIGLLTTQAQSIVLTVHELDNAATPSTESLDKLEAEFAKGNGAAV